MSAVGAAAAMLAAVIGGNNAREERERRIRNAKSERPYDGSDLEFQYHFINKEKNLRVMFTDRHLQSYMPEQIGPKHIRHEGVVFEYVGQKVVVR